MSYEATELVRVDRQQIRKGGLAAFVRAAWPLVEPGRYKDNWHIELICSRLEAVTRGDVRKLLILVPPGTMKSLLTAVFWPAWDWTETPHRKWIYSTYGGNLALKNARQMRDLVNSEWYKARWLEAIIPFQNTHAAAFFTNRSKGFRFSSSPGGEITGRHADRLIADDINKAVDSMGAAALNLTAFDSAWDYWSKILPTRQSDPDTTARVMIQQRLHERDVAGRWMESDPEVEILCLPMVFDESHPWKHLEDPRAHGDLLWPEHISDNAVRDLEKTLGPQVAAAQLQQLPSPQGGAVFQRDWLTQYWRRLPRRYDRMIQSWDLTFGSLKQSASFVVGQVWMQAGADFYLVDQIRDRMSYPQMRDAIRMLTAKYPETTTKLIEKQANGAAILDDLGSEVSGLVPISADTSTGGKLARSHAVTGLFAAGNIYIPDPERAPWVGDMIERFCRFRGAAVDVADEIDSATQALAYLNKRSGSRLVRAMRAARAGRT